MKNRKIPFLWSLFCCAILLHAQAPAGYYSAAREKSGAELKSALFSIISGHVQRTYKDLWTDFQTTDMRPDGKVWDMYSGTTDYTFGEDQAGNYKKEGDVYNREHSFSKSWFNEEYPMYTDLFHIVPTDGYVNGMRSNLPFGETASPTYTSDGGFSKVGPCSLAGYDGKVFEPNDEYKGDFARIYFYMVTAYEDRVSSWDCPMLDGNAYPAYADWALSMLLRWAQEDPVSQKEIDRNNAVFGIQQNRNPYVDYPGLEQYVWGKYVSEGFDPDNYTGGGGTVEPDPVPDVVEAPVFSPASGAVEQGTEVTISCATAGAYIHYSVNGGTEQAQPSPVSFVVEANTTVSAFATSGKAKSDLVTAVYTVRVPEENAMVFVRAASESDLLPGSRCIIVCEPNARALGEKGTDFRKSVPVNVDGSQVETATGGVEQPYAMVLGTMGGAYTFFDIVSSDYLALSANGNKLHALPEPTSVEAQWIVSFHEGNAEIINRKYDSRRIQYNPSSPRFACYTGTQREVALYVERATVDGIRMPLAQGGLVDVYTSDGRLLRSKVPAAVSLRNLPRGIYIVGGTKVWVR